MSVFTKSLDTTNGNVSFTFNRVYTVDGSIYLIWCKGPSIRYIIHMEKIDGEWKIAQLPKAPGWLYQYEGVLAKVILANHKK